MSDEEKKDQKPELRGMCRVIRDTALHFPQEMNVDHNRLWLNPGGVVDMDDPFVRHAVKGQEYKLEPASDGAVASPEKDGRLIAYREQWTNDRAKRRAKRRAELRELEAEDDDLDVGDDDESDDAEKAAVNAAAGGEIQRPDKSRRGQKG